MKRKKHKVILIKLLILLSIINFNLSFGQSFPPGFTHEKVAFIPTPTAMAIGPDGLFYVASSLGGKGIVYKVDGSGNKSTVLTLNTVYSNLEKGLVGLVFDPDFATNKLLYLYYTHDLSGGAQNGDIQNRIVSVEIKNGVADMATLKNILNLDAVRRRSINPNHDGGTMHFGKDGKIYVAVGDQDIYCAQHCYPVTPPDQTCNCMGQDYDLGSWPQDTNWYHGKILRINKDGSAPTDNPFYKQGGSAQRNRIFVLGVRNPYTMHFRKGTTSLYFNDVGANDVNTKKEEINLVETSNLTTTGKNFGWNRSNRDPYDGTPPSAEGNSTNPLFTNPLYFYPGTEGCAIAGGTFYEPSNPTFPAGYVGKYFYLDFCQGWLKYMDADGKNNKPFATGLAFSPARGGFGSFFLEEGSDGNMYHLVRSETENVSGLYRIKGPLAPNSTSDKYVDKYSFSVHPNPANDVLNIHLTGLKSEPATLSITNSLSKEVLNFKVNLTPGFFDTNFNIQSLDRGMYYVNLITEGSTVTKKLVVE